MTENLFDLITAWSDERNYFGILSNVSAEFSKFIFFTLNLSDFLEDFRNCWVEGFSLHHEGRCLKKLSGSEQDCHKLRKFNTIIGDIESVIKCFESVVTIVKLYKAEKVSEFWEDLIVPKEMENVLICYT